MNKGSCPSEIELRTIRAIARNALAEAACRGSYRATFHGFVVQTWRHSIRCTRGTAIKVNFAVTSGRDIWERGVVTVRSKDVAPKYGDAVWRTREQYQAVEPIVSGLVMTVGYGEWLSSIQIIECRQRLPERALRWLSQPD